MYAPEREEVDGVDCCEDEEVDVVVGRLVGGGGGGAWVRLPAPPRPKPITCGWEGAGSWRMREGILVDVLL